MSKRSKNQSLYTQGPRRTAPGGISQRGTARDSVRNTAGKGGGDKTAGGGKSAGGGKTAGAQKGAAKTYTAPTRSIEQLTAGIRVLGFAVALLSLAGALYWAGSRSGSYPPAVLAGMVALGVLAGFGLFVAVRAKEIALRSKRI